MKCEHGDESWYSICSRHAHFNKECGLCNVGKCVECNPGETPVGERMKFWRRDTGEPANPFPELGVRAK